MAGMRLLVESPSRASVDSSRRSSVGQGFCSLLSADQGKPARRAAGCAVARGVRRWLPEAPDDGRFEIASARPTHRPKSFVRRPAMNLFEHLPPRYLTRRHMLRVLATGLGVLGLAGLLRDAGILSATASPIANPLTARPPQFPAHAKHIIHVYLNC